MPRGFAEHGGPLCQVTRLNCPSWALWALRPTPQNASSASRQQPRGRRIIAYHTESNGTDTTLRNARNRCLHGRRTLFAESCSPATGDSQKSFFSSMSKLSWRHTRESIIVSPFAISSQPLTPQSHVALRKHSLSTVTTVRPIPQSSLGASRASKLRVLDIDNPMRLHARRNTSNFSQTLETKFPTWEKRSSMRNRTPWKFVCLRQRTPRTVTLGGRKTAVSMLAPYQDFWVKGFALVNAQYDTKVRQRKALGLNPEVEDWVENLLKYGLDKESIRRAYGEFDTGTRRHCWPGMMLWILERSPEWGLQALLGTHMEPYPPAYAVADVLDHLADFYFGSFRKYDSSATPDLVRDFLDALESLLVHRSPLGQRTLYLLVVHCEAEQIIRLHNLIASNLIELDKHTMLHFAHTFARFGDHERALSWLRRCVAAGARTQYPLFLATCTKILQAASQHRGNSGATAKTVSQMLAMGVRFNTHIFNNIILNAVRADDLNTGVEIFRFMKETNVARDVYTYSILLKGIKEKDDLDSMQPLMDDYILSGLAYSNHWFGAELLHCLYTMHARRKSEHTFKKLVYAYRLFFDMRPLVDLGMVPASSEKLAIGNQNPYTPPASALLTMFLGYLVQTKETRQQQLTDEHSRLYANFRKLVEYGHSDIAPLAETDHVYNSFIRAFGQTRSSLSSCLRVLRDMTAALPATAIHRAYGRPIVPTQPTQQTWSILIEAFARFGQFAAAEKVLEMMRARKWEPNVVTWNSLIKGYAFNQDVDGTVDALRRMQDQGVRMDEATLEGLNQIKDRDALARALALVDKDAKDLKAAEASKSGVESKMSEESEKGDRELEYDAFGPIPA